VEEEIKSLHAEEPAIKKKWPRPQDSSPVQLKKGDDTNLSDKVHMCVHVRE